MFEILATENDTQRATSAFWEKKKEKREEIYREKKTASTLEPPP